MSDQKNRTTHQRWRFGKGEGLGLAVVGAAIAAVALSMTGHDDAWRPNVAAAAERSTVERAVDYYNAETAPGAQLAAADPESGPAYRINKGHVIVVGTPGPGRIDLDDDIRAHAKISTDGARTSIKVDDDYSGDGKIKILIPASAACRVELAAGLLEVKGLPCTETDLVVRSGKMEVDQVPKTHGALKGAVSVGTVSISGGTGQSQRSSGVGDLRAETPATGTGPSLNARVDVGMLTVETE